MKTFEQVYEIVKQIPGLTHEEELRELYSHASKLPEGSLILEIGSYLGLTAALFAETGVQVVCIDPFKEGFDCVGDSSESMEATFKRNVLDVYKNVLLMKYTSEEAVKHVQDNVSFDMIFIDGAHEFVDVEIDCKLWLPKLKVGGVVAFHDYSNTATPGVKQAVDLYTVGYHTVCEKWSMIVKQKQS
jgi:predicted O-methyltransferase YrrM